VAAGLWEVLSEGLVVLEVVPLLLAARVAAIDATVASEVLVGGVTVAVSVVLGSGGVTPAGKPAAARQVALAGQRAG
jgi:hypothetical protein